MANRSVVVGKMKEVQRVINIVTSSLKSNPMYAPYIHFKSNPSSEDYTVYEFEVDNFSTDVNKNIILSFQIEKNGSGKANSFTLTIAYGPNFGTQGWDINRIEDALEKVTKVGSEDEAVSDNRVCSLTYGYSYLSGSDGVNNRLVNDEFKGLIMDYTVELRDNMLWYTITGYSSLAFFKEAKDPFTVETNSDGTQKPTIAAKKLIEKYLGGLALDVAVSYKVVFDGDDIEGSDEAVAMTGQFDKNPALAISEILGMAVHNSQAALLTDPEAFKDEEIITYDWFVSDVHGSDEKEGTIIIVKSDPKEEQELAPDADIVFNWGSAGGQSEGGFDHIVLEFRPEFHGSVSMSNANKVWKNNNYYINDNGDVEETTNTRSPSTGGDSSAVAANYQRERSSWVHDNNYPYKATMTTMGIPADIPITGRIKITPMILGQPHRSAGIYEVLSTVDNISSGGDYTTTWNLMRLVQSEA